MVLATWLLGALYLQQRWVCRGWLMVWWLTCCSLFLGSHLCQQTVWASVCLVVCPLGASLPAEGLSFCLPCGLPIRSWSAQRGYLLFDSAPLMLLEGKLPSVAGWCLFSSYIFHFVLHSYYVNGGFLNNDVNCELLICVYMLVVFHTVMKLHVSLPISYICFLHQCMARCLCRPLVCLVDAVHGAGSVSWARWLIHGWSFS